MEASMLDRTMSTFIKEISKQFPVLLLTAMRQVGKSTLLQSIAEPDRKYISLDDFDIRNLAKTDPHQFLQTYPPPIIIDEIQYAPELFTYIKIYADTHKQSGLFWLSGSQKFSLMKGIQETLTGRVAILDMLGLSYKEIDKKPFESKPFCPSMDLVLDKNAKGKSADDLYKIIWRGFFPEMVVNEDYNRDVFFKSYVKTYIERYARDDLGIPNELKFYNFIRIAAARTGNLINYSEIARDCEINVKTVKIWFSALERSGIIKILPPYHANITKRIIKTPKMYFLDTGLCSFLTGWDSPDSLMKGAMNGAILETYVFCEILKSYWHNGKDVNIYFFRDADQKEIDFVIERNMMLYPMDVKKTSAPSKTNLGAFKTLKNRQESVAIGAMICFYPEILPISKDIISIPIWAV
jgi:predicted AAA+ superfamily ATPase